MQWTITAEQPEFPGGGVPQCPNVLLQTQHVSVSFNRNPVLRDINLTVSKGESIAIIGESGCGKTVLLKTLIRLFEPTEGNVIFDGRDLADLSYFELAQTRTRYGFVFQQAALFDSMTIGENVAFPLVQHTDKPKDEIKNIVIQLLEEVGLSADVAGKKPAELSGGMRKRAGFARALALDPELLLYDEPTTGLDPIMSGVINELMISTRQKHNVTSVMITHDIKSAFKVAERIIFLYPLTKLNEHTPQIIFDGTPDEMKQSNDKRVKQFIK
ncbi:MAG: ABC transporter ATP-binding protein [Planctomycetaceae bacterium]|jgi:phospholipid/cholesterol/gamma-HCH transport system ATP-binding protein|nr:ABC transporter ATP-binding protein [Planctomycetaceae bacterium]